MSDMTVDTGGGRERRVPVDYPSNSKKAREPEAAKPKVEQVVVGEVTRRKRSKASRALGALVAEDGPSVLQYIVMEVLVPAAKSTISDVVSQGIERMLYGDSRPRPAAGGRPGYTNYARFTAGRAIPGSDSRPDLSRQARTTHNFSDVILESRGEAEDVLDGLRDLVSQYQQATVNDFYDLVGLTGEFTDDKWGWTDLRSAEVRAIRGGYWIRLPRTQPIV